MSKQKYVYREIPLPIDQEAQVQRTYNNHGAFQHLMNHITRRLRDRGKTVAVPPAVQFTKIEVDDPYRLYAIRARHAPDGVVVRRSMLVIYVLMDHHEGRMVFTYFEPGGEANQGTLSMVTDPHARDIFQMLKNWIEAPRDHQGWTFTPSLNEKDLFIPATYIANMLVSDHQEHLANGDSAVTFMVPPYLPCPICDGVEGCDHTVTERAAAAGVKESTSDLFEGFLKQRGLSKDDMEGDTIKSTIFVYDQAIKEVIDLLDRTTTELRSQYDQIPEAIVNHDTLSNETLRDQVNGRSQLAEKIVRLDAAKNLLTTNGQSQEGLIRATGDLITKASDEDKK